MCEVSPEMFEAAGHLIGPGKLSVRAPCSLADFHSPDQPHLGPTPPIICFLVWELQVQTCALPQSLTKATLEVDLQSALSPAVPIWLTELPQLSSALTHDLTLSGGHWTVGGTNPALLSLVGYCGILLSRSLCLPVLWSPFAPG